MPSVVLDTFYTYSPPPTANNVTLLYVRVTGRFASRGCLFIFIFIHLFRMWLYGNWTRCQVDSCGARGGDQRTTKGVKSQSMFACLHVGTGEFRTSPRITANSSKRFNIRCLSARPTACGFSVFLRKRPTRRSTRSTDFSRGYDAPSGERVDRISPVIYSMRVGDVSPSFVVILAVPRHGGGRDEGETRVERGLKHGKGTERYGIAL